MFPQSYQFSKLSAMLQTASLFPDVFKPREPQSHKGTYGTLAVIGGAQGMSGAVVLASTAAIYQGCGKVWAGFKQPQLPFAIIPDRPEIMLATADDLLQRTDITAFVCGCGMGLDASSEPLLKTVLSRTDHAVLLDADALTLLSRSEKLQQQAKQHGNLALTPHSAEAARLLGTTTAEIQADRPFAVQTLSDRFQATVVLKGHQSLVCSPEGTIYTNHSGNAGLATAGSGDVLSGIIGSLLAQKIDMVQAVQAGVWLHGAAADVLAASEIGEIGMLAGEIAPAARWLRNKLTRALLTQNQNPIQENWI